MVSEKLFYIVKKFTPRSESVGGKLLWHILFIQQPVDQIQRLDAVVGIDEAEIHRQHDLFVVVRNHAQRAKLPFAGFRRLHTFRHLDIYFIVWLFCNEVDFGFSDLPDVHPVVTAEQFQKHDILNNVSTVCIPVAQQHIAEAYVDDIVLTQRF